MKFFTVHKEFKRVSEEAGQLMEKCEFKFKSFGNISESDKENVLFYLSKLNELFLKCIDANLPMDASRIYLQITCFESIMKYGMVICDDAIEEALYNLRIKSNLVETKKESIAYDIIINDYKKIISML